MKKETRYINEIIQIKRERGFCDYIECSPEDSEKYLQLLKSHKELPGNIFYETDKKGNNSTRVIHFYKAEHNHPELLYLEYLFTKIKTWITFFGVLTIIGLVAGFIVLLVFLNNVNGMLK